MTERKKQILEKELPGELLFLIEKREGDRRHDAEKEVADDVCDSSEPLNVESTDNDQNENERRGSERRQ